MAKTKSRVFADTFVLVSKTQRYRNKWLVDETWYQLMVHHSPTLQDINFSRKAMNTAISKNFGSKMDIFDNGNKSGMFRRTHSGVCPITKVCRTFTCYYVTDPGQIVDRPRSGVEFWDSLDDLKVRAVRKRKRDQMEVSSDQPSDNNTLTDNTNQGMII